MLNIQKDIGKFYNHLTYLGDRKHVEKTLKEVDVIWANAKENRKRHAQLTSKYTKIWWGYVFVTAAWSSLDSSWWMWMVSAGGIIIYMNLRAFKPVDKEWSDFYDNDNELHETNPLFANLIETYYMYHYDKLPRRIVEFVMESEEEFMLYEMDATLIPENLLPDGMVMKKDLLFESAGKKFQIAINKGNEVRSYIVFPINSTTGRLELDDITIEYVKET